MMKLKLLALGFVAAVATTAVAGPDFISGSPRKPLAASDGRGELLPWDDVVFAHDSSVLSNTAATQIDTAAAWFGRDRQTRIVLEGYADHTGMETYNDELAMRRAQSVRGHLIERGVAPERIVVIVFGEATSDPAGSSLDRRVILYASNQPAATVVRTSFDRKHARAAIWTTDRALITETPRSRRVPTTIAIR